MAPGVSPHDGPCKRRGHLLCWNCYFQDPEMDQELRSFCGMPHPWCAVDRRDRGVCSPLNTSPPLPLAHRLFSQPIQPAVRPAAARPPTVRLAVARPPAALPSAVVEGVHPTSSAVCIAMFAKTLELLMCTSVACFCDAGIDGPAICPRPVKRPRRRREPLPELPPRPLPIPFEAYGQPGTFNFRFYDGRTAGFDRAYTATYSDSWAAQVEAQRDGFRGALMTNLSGT